MNIRIVKNCGGGYINLLPVLKVGYYTDPTEQSKTLRRLSIMIGVLGYSLNIRNYKLNWEK